MAQDTKKQPDQKPARQVASRDAESVAVVGPTAAPTVLLSAAQYARQELAREMAELRKNPLDRAKRPGGVYGNEGGDGWHDAEGRELNEDGSPKKQKQQPDE